MAANLGPYSRAYYRRPHYWTSIIGATNVAPIVVPGVVAPIVAATMVATTLGSTIIRATIVALIVGPMIVAAIAATIGAPATGATSSPCYCGNKNSFAILGALELCFTTIAAIAAIVEALHFILAAKHFIFHFFFESPLGRRGQICFANEDISLQLNKMLRIFECFALQIEQMRGGARIFDLLFMLRCFTIAQDLALEGLCFQFCS